MRRGAGFGGGRMNRFNAGPGMGRGRRFGGYGYSEAARSSEEIASDEKSILTAQAEILQRDLEAIKKRLDSLDNKKE